VSRLYVLFLAGCLVIATAGAIVACGSNPAMIDCLWRTNSQIGNCGHKAIVPWTSVDRDNRM
jgi:hypothetical protein